MSCCSEVIDIGCINPCVATTLNYNASETGDHTLEFYLVNGTVQAETESYTAGSAMSISADLLNESRQYDLKIKQPSGSYYTFPDGVQCLRLTTRVFI